MKTKKKTITLSIGADPSLVLCPGHVDQKTFNQAFKNEGWSEPGGYKQRDLEYGYFKKRKNGAFVRSVPGKEGVKPFTFANWD